MSEFINSVDILGDDAVIDSIIDKSITEYKDKNLTYIGHSIFYYCELLTLIDLPIVTNIYGDGFSNGAFHKCSCLKAVILRNTNRVCAISHVNAFVETPINAGTGYIYVPSALIEDYKAATNWSTYAEQFRALEDYTVDGTTTGELDETKI